jgi:mannose-P-dolichol utilization defect protein 1
MGLNFFSAYFKLYVFNAQFLSKLVGYSILITSCIIKFPQIKKIYDSKSAHGLSIASELLMLIASFGSVAYGYFMNYSIASYGSHYPYFIQQTCLIYLMFHYNKHSASKFILIVAVTLVSFLLYMNMLSRGIILFLNGLQALFSVSSKSIQIITNFRLKNVSNLSSATLWIQFWSSLGRIFTSIQETGDLNLILVSGALFQLNSVLLAQFYWYSRRSKAD